MFTNLRSTVYAQQENSNREGEIFSCFKEQRIRDWQSKKKIGSSHQPNYQIFCPWHCLIDQLLKPMKYKPEGLEVKLLSFPGMRK